MGSQQVGGGKMRLLFAILSVIAAAASALPARTLGFGGTTWTLQGTGKTSRTITTYGFNTNNGEFYTETYDGALGLDGWTTPSPATNNNPSNNNNNNSGSGAIAARQPQYVQTDKSA